MIIPVRALRKVGLAGGQVKGPVYTVRSRIGVSAQGLQVNTPSGEDEEPGMRKAGLFKDIAGSATFPLCKESYFLIHIYICIFSMSS